MGLFSNMPVLYKSDIKKGRKRYDKLETLGDKALWQTGTIVSIHDRDAYLEMQKILSQYSFRELAAMFESANRGCIKSEPTKRMVEDQLIKIVQECNNRLDLENWSMLTRSLPAFFNVDRAITIRLQKVKYL